MGYGINYNEKRQETIKAPILKNGIIASEVFKNEFIVDAMVNNGNSGSPVFMQSNKKSILGYVFTGIVKQFQHDSIKVKLNGSQKEKIPHNSGMGIVVPSQVIADFIKRE